MLIENPIDLLTYALYTKTVRAKRPLSRTRFVSPMNCIDHLRPCMGLPDMRKYKHYCLTGPWAPALADIFWEGNTYFVVKRYIWQPCQSRLCRSVSQSVRPSGLPRGLNIHQT